MPKESGPWRRVRALERLAPGWLIVYVFGTVGLVVVLLTAKPQAPWVWVVLVSAFAGWVLWMVFETRRPRLAIGLIAAASVVPAFAIGASGDATALIVTCVVLGRFASLASPPGALIAAVWAADVVLALVTSLRGDVSGVATLGAVGLLCMVVLLGLHPRQMQLRARQAEQLLEQTRLAQQEHARAAALDERARIAREMHDVLAHSLGALGMQLEVAEGLLSEKSDAAGALERVRRSRRLAREGLTEAREAVAALRRDIPPLAEALAELTEAHARNHGVDAGLRVEGTARPIAPATTVALLRTAREALTNAARHAPGGALALTLRYGERAVCVRVGNEPTVDIDRAGVDGVGSFGLTGMRERVALVGGTLEAGRVDGEPGGWLVTAEVPDD